MNWRDNAIVPTGVAVTLAVLKGTVPNQGPVVAYNGPLHVKDAGSIKAIVAVYHVGRPSGPYTNMVANTVVSCSMNWIPHPDSAGIHHRSDTSVVFAVADR